MAPDNSDMPWPLPFPGQSLPLAESLTAAAQAMHAAQGPAVTMSTAVRLARDIVPGAEQAGITMVDRGTRVRTPAFTSETVPALDSALPVGDGAEPHWHPLWERPVVRVEDISPAARSSLAAHRVRSMLGLRLSVGYRRLTVLGLYAERPDAFDQEAVRTGRLLAAHIAIALESAGTKEQLTEAMRTRDIIGQATGVLMARLNLDAQEAFARLVRTSQQENVKVRDIAFRVVEAVGVKNANRPEGVG